MMRIAIAGSGGLAQHLAHYINDTPHPFIILSRAVSYSTQLAQNWSLLHKF
jgi:hypothetical protein